jgi:GH15 family glucan-1,4-alpha-glucosidase
MAEETANFWRGWLARSTYRGRWRDMVARSAMTPKAFSHLALISAAINLDYQLDHGAGVQVPALTRA